LSETGTVHWEVTPLRAAAAAEHSRSAKREDNAMWPFTPDIPDSPIFDRGQLIGLSFITLITFGLGVYCIGRGIVDHYQVSERLKWPQVQGTVESNSLRSNSIHGLTLWFGKLGYRYEVNGVSYHQEISGNEELSTYPEGRTCAVYYNPSNPAEACLAVTLDPSSPWAGAWIGAWILFVAAFMARGCHQCWKRHQSLRALV
jgi:hypothetical protein